MKQPGAMKLVVSLFLFIGACHRWISAQAPTPAQELQSKPARVLVFFNDGTPPIIVLNPSSSADSLIGEKYTGLVGVPVRFAIPMTQVKELQVPRFSPLATIGLLLGVSVAAFVVFAYMLATSLET